MRPFHQAEDSGEFRSAESTLSWGEYLGLVDTTVTDIVVRNETTHIPDPHVVVTFSVVGCQPAHPPFNLQYCKTNSP
jgi:hypothetical protein